MELNTIVTVSVILPIASLSSAQNISSIDLTDANFELQTQTGNWFVMFYKNQCGHSSRMMPIFKELAQSIKTNSSVATSPWSFGKVGGEELTEACRRIRGCPRASPYVYVKFVAMFRGPCNVVNVYHSVNALHQFHKFLFWTTLPTFSTRAAINFNCQAFFHSSSFTDFKKVCCECIQAIKYLSLNKCALF